MNPDDIAVVLREQEEKMKLDVNDPKKAYVPKVLIEFENIEAAQQAAITLGGLKYDNRTIITGFYDEELFQSAKY